METKRRDEPTAAEAMSTRKEEVERVEEAVLIMRNEHPDLFRCPVCRQVDKKKDGEIPLCHQRADNWEICWPGGK